MHAFSGIRTHDPGVRTGETDFHALDRVAKTASVV
jgi:hypothetical protein